MLVRSGCICVYVFQQDAEWAKVTTAADTFLCRAVIVTCPPHLAGQCASPTSADWLNEIPTDAEGGCPTPSTRLSNVANCASMQINLDFSLNLFGNWGVAEVNCVGGTALG